LRQIIFRCYYRDFRNLKRRITFRGLTDTIASLETILYDNAFNPQENPKDLQPYLLTTLREMRQTLISNHDGLFVNIVESLIEKVKLFGSYFATLDIRQDSRVLRDVFKYTTEKVYTGVPKNYADLDEVAKLKSLPFNQADFKCPDTAEPLIQDTLNTIRLMKQIQHSNGERVASVLLSATVSRHQTFCS